MKKPERENGSQTELVCLLSYCTVFLSEVWKRDELHTNEKFFFSFLFFYTGEDVKSSVLFSPTVIILRISEAEVASLGNLNNELNEVISMGGIRACQMV